MILLPNRITFLQSQFLRLLKRFGGVFRGDVLLTPSLHMLLLHIVTDAENKNTDTGRGARNQADGANGENSLTG